MKGRMFKVSVPSSYRKEPKQQAAWPKTYPKEIDKCTLQKAPPTAETKTER